MKFSDFGFVAIVVLVLIAIYIGLRKRMLGPKSSLLKRVIFVLAAGTAIAPGLFDAGHPPPIPVPAMALFFWLIGESGSYFSNVNGAVWLAVTCVIGAIEFVRLLDAELQPEVQAAGDEAPGQDCKSRHENSSSGKSKYSIAEFSSTTNESTTCHRAVIEQHLSGLRLSMYAGKSYPTLSLIETYEAPGWEELDAYLVAKTVFRRGDFREES